MGAALALDTPGHVFQQDGDAGDAGHVAAVAGGLGLVDDAAQGITLVTRGEDLLAATHVHRLLQVLLSYPEPLYLHHELIRDENGKRLATRDEALALSTLRESGMTAAAILDRLPPVPPCDGKLTGGT